MSEVAKRLNDSVEKHFSNSIRQFGEYMGSAAASILKAAMVYAADVNRFPKEAPIRYKETYPHVSERGWEILRAIGNEDLTPTAFLCEKETTINAVKTLDIKTQRIVLGDEKNPAVPQRVWSNGKVVSKLLSDMTRQEVSRVINTETGKLRTIEEQKKSILDDSDRRQVKIPTMPYRIFGKTLRVFGACDLGANEIYEIAKKIGVVNA